MVVGNTLRIRDLKNSPLSIIPKEDLDVVVRIPRILRGQVASRFEYDKSAVPADAAGKRLCRRIGKLPDDRIDLSPNRDGDGRQGYNC